MNEDKFIKEYEEWKVTGNPGNGDPPYNFIWSSLDAHNQDSKKSEAAAKKFCRMILERRDWEDGPHLHKRTVKMTDWEEVDINE